MEMQYGYNLAHPSSGAGTGNNLNVNQLAGSTNDDDGFTFQNLQLLADKPLTTRNSTGFRVRAEYGDVARFDNRDPNFNTTSSAFFVREAYMTWRTFGYGSVDHTDITVGQMDSPLGIETPDNTTNWLVTRSFEHNLATPITHLGVRAVLPWSAACKTAIYGVNGWDNTRDTNGGKTLILSQDVGPFENLKSTFTANFSYGDEGSVSTSGTGPASNKTMFGEVIWRMDLDEKNRVAADAFWAKQEDGAFDGSGSIETRYYDGVSGYFRHQLTKDAWLAARGEYYADDAFGQANGILRVVGASVAVGFDVGPDLTIVLEVRHDHAMTGDPFLGQHPSSNPESDQDRITASAVYRF
jgi:hypothetical protein